MIYPGRCGSEPDVPVVEPRVLVKSVEYCEEAPPHHHGTTDPDPATLLAGCWLQS